MTSTESIRTISADRRTTATKGAGKPRRTGAGEASSGAVFLGSSFTHMSVSGNGCTAKNTTSGNIKKT